MIVTRYFEILHYITKGSQLKSGTCRLSVFDDASMPFLKIFAKYCYLCCTCSNVDDTLSNPDSSSSQVEENQFTFLYVEDPPEFLPRS